MALQIASSSLSSSFSSSLTRPPNRKYDVFLSFRGETRHRFVSHLYNELEQRGIRTFIDNRGLETGEPISPGLSRAIEESWTWIVVLSESYASSRWCLEELVKILECRNSIGRTVVPIFYYVEPSEVRRQTGSFGKGFAELINSNHHEIEDGQFQRWKEALTEIGNLKGWPYPSIRSESEFIEQLVRENFTKLSPRYSGVDGDLVVMNDPMQREIETLSLSFVSTLVGMASRVAQKENMGLISSNDEHLLSKISENSPYPTQNLNGVIQMVQITKKIVFKLDIHDDRAKNKAMKIVCGVAGTESVSVDMKHKKFIVTGDIDPVDVVSKLRKLWHTEIIAIEPAKEPEKKKEEPKKEEANLPKKNKKEEAKKEEGKNDDEKEKGIQICCCRITVRFCCPDCLKRKKSPLTLTELDKSKSPDS